MAKNIKLNVIRKINKFRTIYKYDTIYENLTKNIIIHMV